MLAIQVYCLIRASFGSIQICRVGAEMGHPDSRDESRSPVTLQLTERHANSDLQATQEERDSLTVSVCVRETEQEEEEVYGEIKPTARLCETNRETARNIKGEEESISEKEGREESLRKGRRREQTLGRNQNSKGGKFLKQ